MGPENNEAKILLVDDVPANLDILLMTLEKEGYSLSLAPSGEVALQIAERFQPDLILMDIMMPSLNGFQTCEKLKAEPATRDIPVIFISAKNELEDIVEGFRVGGVDYVTKPFRQEEVLSRVKTHLQLQSLKTQRENLIAKLESKNRNLVELNEIKNKFLGIAAHDLRSPLATIKGISDVLLMTDLEMDENETRDMIEFVKRISTQALNLVDSLLDISVIESGKLTIQLQSVRMNSFIEDRIRIHSFHASKKDIKIHSSLAPVPECRLDPDRIGQVVDNLVGNAVKFSPAGSNIYVSLKRENDTIRFQVRDEGPGIPREEQSRLFREFHKSLPKPTGEEKGAGLGLAIARKIIEAHHGILELDSTQGAGSTFSFAIPFEKK